MDLFSTQYENIKRTVSGTYAVDREDVVLLCDTSLAAVIINLATIPADYWNTIYKLYVVDNSSNAATNNITINAPAGYTINDGPSVTINTNGSSVIVRISANTKYLASSNNSNSLISIPVKNTVFVMKNGSDSTGLVERFDKPFLTIAAARAAVSAYYTGPTAPSATNRVRIEVYSGTYTETITLDTYVDYDLKDIVLRQTSPGALISDNGVPVNSMIFGCAKLVSTTSGGAATYGIYLSSSSSYVSASFESLIMTGTASTVIRGIRCVGTLIVNFNFLTVNESTGNTVGILADLGTIYATAYGDVYTSTTGLQNAMASVGIGAKLYFNGRDVTANGTTGLAMATISSQTGGKAYINCNNIYHTNSGASAIECGALLCATESGPELYVKCNKIIVSVAAANGTTCCQVGRSGSATTASGVLDVTCVEATITAAGASNNAITMEDCDSATVATFRGKYRVVDGGGTNVSCVNNKTASGSAGKLILENASLIAIGSGKCITSNAAASVYVYGSCQANKAIDTAFVITLLVGTVANGRFIENDSNVI